MNTTKKLLRAGLLVGILGVLGFALLHTAAAADPLPLPGVVTGINSPDTIGTTVCTVINWIFYAAIVLSIALVLVAAFKYMTGSGDPEKIKSAHKTLLYVAIGVAVALCARVLPIAVGAFLSVRSGLDPCAFVSSPGSNSVA